MSSETATLRRCVACAADKPLSEFYHRSGPKPRHDTSCKPCRRAKNRRLHHANAEACRARARIWRLNNAERKRAADARWRAANVERKRANDAAWYYANRERAAENCRLWRKRNPEKRKAAQLAWIARNPQKRRAQEMVQGALHTGKLTRKPCEVCGAKGQAHHDDYSKPLEVRWLCTAHHAELHRKRVPPRPEAAS